ncbi:hypothetical protein BMMON2_02770 [Burkholderia mallei]
MRIGNRLLEAGRVDAVEEHDAGMAPEHPRGEIRQMEFRLRAMAIRLPKSGDFDMVFAYSVFE